MNKGMLGMGLFVILALPPMAKLLEASMVGQMLIQMPALVYVGILITPYLSKFWPRWLEGFNGNGVSGIILVLFVTTFWMLPRSLDAALSKPSMEMAKFISLPLFVGIPLALSWPKLGFMGKHFVWANLISMFGVMAWLYLAAPVRLCNYYLVNQQTLLGWAFLLITIASFVFWAAPALFGDHRSEEYRDIVEEDYMDEN